MKYIWLIMLLFLTGCVPVYAGDQNVASLPVDDSRVSYAGKDIVQSLAIAVQAMDNTAKVTDYDICNFANTRPGRVTLFFATCKAIPWWNIVLGITVFMVIGWVNTAVRLGLLTAITRR